MTISPSGIVPICNGEQTEVTCTVTEGSFLRWNITLPEDQVDGHETMTAQYFLRTFSSSATSSEQSPANTSSAIITFVRSSARGDTPLISKILISRILNGSTLKCIELATSESVNATVYLLMPLTDLNLHCKK